MDLLSEIGSRKGVKILVATAEPTPSPTKSALPLPPFFPIPSPCSCLILPSQLHHPASPPISLTSLALGADSSRPAGTGRKVTLLRAMLENLLQLALIALWQSTPVEDVLQQ